MTYERLITAVDEVAPELSDIAYKLLWRLIALAIHRGTPEVEASMRGLASGLNLSKEGVARATRELAVHIRVTARDGEGTTFSLPPDWFPPQRTLFSDDRLGGDIHNRPGSQDASVLFPRTPASHLPGHQRPGSQDTRPISQDASVPFPRTPVLFPRTQRPISQDAGGSSPIRNAGARVDRSIEGSSSEIEVLLVIDRAFHTVEILPDQQEAAEIVTDALRTCRLNFDSDAYASSRPDRKVIARILAIAPIDQLCYVLRTIADKRTRPGDSDMWFFSVLLHRIHSIPAATTRERIHQLSAKAQSLNGNPSLFPDQLVNEMAARIRKLG